MADALDQIQASQARAREEEIAGAQHDLDWNSTFGKMAPDNVLRETRNMTALIANAVERKMALAAQTSAEAQRIYINDQKWKAEQRMQPMKDDRLRAQIRADEARARATTAQELLATSRLERDATAIEHTASAEFEMDQIESATIPEAEKRARVNAVRGKYPLMNNDAKARHGKLLGPTEDEKIAQAVKMKAATTAAAEQAKAAGRPTPEQIREDKVETARQINALKPPKEPQLPGTGTETITKNLPGGGKQTVTRPLPRSVSGGVAQPSQVDMPAAAAPVATTAAAQPRMVRQNGVTYTLQPDGSYK